MALRFLLLAIFAIFSPAVALANPQGRPGVEGKRELAGERYFWVGKLLHQGRMSCAAFLVKPDLALSAKHCFQRKGFNQDTIHRALGEFALTFGSKEAPVKVTELQEIQFDSGANDIVLLRFSSSFLEGKVAVPAMEFFRGEVGAGIELQVVGFPRPDFFRVVSIGCRSTGMRAPFPPMPMDPGYTGVFEDTTCGAWFGVSGGPVFHENADGSVVLYGLVTHTFDVLSDGSVDDRFVRWDAFGSYTTSMFSALSTARDLP